jgi:hypothetical protein
VESKYIVGVEAFEAGRQVFFSFIILLVNKLFVSL